MLELTTFACVCVRVRVRARMSEMRAHTHTFLSRKSINHKNLKLASFVLMRIQTHF